jgi:hypothetical protein
MKTLPHDKANHVAAGAWVAGASALAALAVPSIEAWLAAAAGCAAAAVAREAYNRARGGPFDWMDIAATLAGGVPVALSAWVA